MASLRAERAAGGPRLPATRAARPAALRLLLLLGAVLKSHETLAQPYPTRDTLDFKGKSEENYEKVIQVCWHYYKHYMDSIEKDWCDWAMISRRGLSCSNPKPAPGSIPEETPFLSGEQLGIGGGREGEICCDACKKAGGSHLGAECACSRAHLHPASVYTKELGAGTFI